MKWYRVDAQHWATVDEDGDTDGSYTTLRSLSYEVVRETPKGVWLLMRKPMGMGVTGQADRRFVLRDPVHRGRVFAAPTEAQAIEDFKLRKTFELRMLANRAARAEADRALAERARDGITLLHRVEWT